jgi:hypothetical protein
MKLFRLFALAQLGGVDGGWAIKQQVSSRCAGIASLRVSGFERDFVALVDF